MPSFLRIPPFPGHRASPIAQPGCSSGDANGLAAAIRRERVGGRFWGPWQTLVVGCDRLLAPDSSEQLQAMLAALREPGVTIVANPGLTVPRGFATIPPGGDPWHLAEQASEVWAGANQELALVAALSGTRVRTFGEGPYKGCEGDPAVALAQAVAAWRYASPFDQSEWNALQAVKQLGAWRRLIDANRGIDAAAGIAGWKRITLDPLLWDGTRLLASKRVREGRDRRIVAWKSRAPKRVANLIESNALVASEIEDGFIRSVGLGANCVPPLSIVVDMRGIYFDPSQASDLEYLLEHSEFDSTLCQRASTLRARLVQAAISKYGQPGGVLANRSPVGKRRVLVTGQVEDDRSILSGGSAITNLGLLTRARDHEREAWIIYRPHPDVEAGHRKGHVPDAEALRYADEIDRNSPIAALIDSVDALHVITSLAGFEALLRGKAVTAHGVPFYAGWGLTTDLGPIPERRTRRRSLDELVAAALLVYPRYLDPVTRLPCPAEVLVERLANNQARVGSPLIWLREWQGRIRSAWRRLAGGR